MNALSPSRAAAVHIPMAPGSNIDAYLAVINSLPRISAEEERALAVRLADCQDAARQLVMSQLTFVVHIARSYAGYGLPLADLNELPAPESKIADGVSTLR